MTVAYRLDKATKKIEQFGVKIIQSLIAANSLDAIHHLQREFAALVDRSLAEELDTYFHIVRDGSIRQLLLPKNYEEALQDSFLASEGLATASTRAETEAILITGPFKQLLSVINEVSGPLSPEQALQLYYTYVLPQVTSGAGNTVVLPGGLSDAAGVLASVGAAFTSKGNIAKDS